MIRTQCGRRVVLEATASRALTAAGASEGLRRRGPFAFAPLARGERLQLTVRTAALRDIWPGPERAAGAGCRSGPLRLRIGLDPLADTKGGSIPFLGEGWRAIEFPSQQRIPLQEAPYP
jgi:hypothetical protein